MKKIIFISIIAGLFFTTFAQNTTKTKTPTRSIFVVNKGADGEKKVKTITAQQKTTGTKVAKEKKESKAINTAQPKFAIKPHVNIGLGDPYKIMGEHIDNQKSSAVEFGLDFGYNVYSNEWFNIYAYAGFGVEKSTIEITQAGLSYQYETDQDVDGDTYIRKYENINLSQKVGLNDLIIPVFAEIEYPVFNKFYAYADLGIRFSFSGNSSVSSVNGTYSVSGLYPQYGNMVLGGVSEINGFTSHGTISDKNCAAYNIERNKSNNIKLLAQIGARYNVWDQLFIDLSLGYIRSFKTVLTTDGESYANYPIHYTLESGETFNAFASESRQLINKFSINIGVMYKF